MTEYLPMDALENRRAYQLKSRNLLVGFWNADKRGFMGVREKFRDRYLFTEYHYDADERLGTAHAFETLDLWLPEDIPFRENLDLACQVCHKAVEQIYEPDDRFHTGKRCVGDRHLEKTDCEPSNPHFGYWPMNKDAFDLLDPWDQKFVQKRIDDWR